MAKRLFDIVFALGVLIAVSPFLIFAAIGVAISSPGPVLYHANRVGKDMKNFKMLKFRSMTVGADKSGAITSQSDSRVFPFGALLRKLKVDELPQFLNVLKGEMSIVGPRPEDPGIVERSYTPWMKETLLIKPGITSPGALFYYAFGLEILGDGDAEKTYLSRLLAPKLAIDRAYMDRATFWSDLQCVCMTFLAIIATGLGFSIPPRPIDMEAAKKYAHFPESLGQK